jgi:hypothetical protein
MNGIIAFVISTIIVFGGSYLFFKKDSLMAIQKIKNVFLSRKK